MQMLKNKQVAIPKLGLGTYQLRGEQATDVVQQALDLGFRHVDTASIYGNEREVGKGLKQAGTPRDQVFLTTKVWRDSLRKQDFLKSADTSLSTLQVDYLDLLLIHWPNSEVSLEETLEAGSILIQKGKVRFLGVSNFPKQLLQEAKAKFPNLLTNQVEYHAWLSQDTLLKTCRKLDMFLTAYCPLARGELVRNQQVLHIASKYKKTGAQIALKWLMQQEDVVAIVKSSSKERLEENLNIFDFDISPEDQKKLTHLSHNNKRLLRPPFAPSWDN